MMDPHRYADRYADLRTAADALGFLAGIALGARSEGMDHKAALDYLSQTHGVAAVLVVVSRAVDAAVEALAPDAA